MASCGKTAITKTKVSTPVDSLSYAVGVNLYYSLYHDSLDLNPAVLAKAMMDAKEGKAYLDEDGCREFIFNFMNKKELEKQAKQVEMNKVTYKDNIAQGDSFLQKNKEVAGVVVTASGLQYKVIKLGNGPKPTETDVVKVHYTGTTIDGKKFDSSVDRGEPAQFTVNGVIKGWVEGLQLMPVGSKYMLYIPSELGYGATGASDVIEPYSTLIFEVELLEIVKQK
ncbi:MAG: FKBP-type peptidyl-prolyl cis-trans isomerase [Bacteroidales bacterium]